MRNYGNDAAETDRSNSYNNRHQTLVQTWIATECRRRVRRTEASYEEVYEEVCERVFAYGQHIDQLVGEPAGGRKTGSL